ncbi:GGDEF domain-containing protein [Shewanella sp.]|uniref:GGDEF domain-containing protein n=1 Tax=Shewanella sp. TaxID=50422 RepID=UPI003A97C744
MPKTSMLQAIWDNGHHYRRGLLRTMLWIIALLAFLMAFSNVYAVNGRPFIIVETIVGLYCVVFLWRLPQIKCLRLWSGLLLLMVFSIIASGIATKAMHVDGFFWLMMMPPLSLLLMGLRAGAVLSLLFGSIGVVLMITTQPLDDGSLDVPLMVNAIASYLAIWIMSHVYETRRLSVINQLQQVASHDPLTGLYNRLHLETIFKRLVLQHQQLPQSRHFALLLIDVDFFKQLNDNYGHEAGDLILAQLAEELRRNTRATDWLFRVGGEEFCVLLAQSDASNAYHVAEHLRKQLAQHRLNYQNHSINFTISIGIASWPNDGENLDTLYRNADAALYQAKRDGRNITVSCTASNTAEAMAN